MQRLSIAMFSCLTTLLLCAATNVDAAPVARGPAYFQMGVGNSPQDDAQFAGTQGVKSDIFVTNDQRFPSVSFHFFWAATLLAEPADRKVFVQIGYSVSQTGGALIPFIYTANSAAPKGNRWLNFAKKPLTNAKWYTFAFATDGHQKSDGTYDWTFSMQPEGGAPVVLAVIPFMTDKTAQAPFLVSEIAGAKGNACDDSFDVTYGKPNSGSALLALKDQRWQPVLHGRTFLGYGPCASGDVISAGFQQARTRIAPNTPRSAVYLEPFWGSTKTAQAERTGFGTPQI